jgi:hypothetical protein
MAERKRLTTITFHGESFEDAGLELDWLPDLVAYKRLVVESAKALWRRNHPDRVRLPRGYEDSIRLKFYGAFETASTQVPLFREFTRDPESQFLLAVEDEVDEAVDLIEETIEAAGRGSTLPDRLPRSVVPYFEFLGRRLAETSSLTLQSERRNKPALYTQAIRERLTSWVEPSFADVVSLTGEVSEADVYGRSFILNVPDGTRVPGIFDQSHESEITDALHRHEAVSVQINGLGEFSASDGLLLRIARIDSLRILSDPEAFDPSVPPIWEVAAAIGASVPAEEWAKVPTDLAANFDSYAYGSRRKD